MENQKIFKFKVFPLFESAIITLCCINCGPNLAIYIEHNTRIIVPHIRGFSPFYHVLMVLLEKLNNKKKEAPNSSIQEPHIKAFHPFCHFTGFKQFWLLTQMNLLKLTWNFSYPN